MDFLSAIPCPLPYTLRSIFRSFCHIWMFDKWCLHARRQDNARDILFVKRFQMRVVSCCVCFSSSHLPVNRTVRSCFAISICIHYLSTANKHQTLFLTAYFYFSTGNFFCVSYKQFKYDDYFDVSSHCVHGGREVNKWIYALSLLFHHSTIEHYTEARVAWATRYRGLHFICSCTSDELTLEENVPETDREREHLWSNRFDSSLFSCSFLLLFGCSSHLNRVTDIATECCRISICPIIFIIF